MKIAFTLFRYFPEGGLQQDMLKIAQACLEHGAEISIFTMQWQGKRPDNISVNVIPGSGLTAVAKRNSFVKKYLLKLRHSEFSTVIGFNRMPGLDYYYAADSCFAFKAKGERGFLYRLTSRCRQYLRWEKAVFNSESNTKILLISPLQKQQYLKYYPGAFARIVDLPPGIKIDRRAAEDCLEQRISTRQTLGITDSSLLIIQIGAYFKVKGVNRSLHAIAALSEELKTKVQFVLVGKDDSTEYMSLASTLGIKKQFRVLEKADSIPSLLQAADLMLHPAISESAGMVLLEAVVAGLPVLTTDTCGYAYYVEKAEAGLVCSSPFSQQNLNITLGKMLNQLDSSAWKSNGIAFGKCEDLYQMPTKVTELIIAK